MTVISIDYATLGDAAEERGDFAMAMQLFRHGAADDCYVCMDRLGYLFDCGVGVEIDKAEAMRWYRRSWRLTRSSCAGNNIAILYREAGNRRAMFQWFRRTAEHNEGGDAWLELAKCYLEGVGVRRSDEEAMRCLIRVTTAPFTSEAAQEEAEELLEDFRPRLV